MMISQTKKQTVLLLASEASVITHANTGIPVMYVRGGKSFSVTQGRIKCRSVELAVCGYFGYINSLFNITTHKTQRKITGMPIRKRLAVVQGRKNLRRSKTGTSGFII